jgi:tetratricopeptide (TPR) repeat protein
MTDQGFCEALQHGVEVEVQNLRARSSAPETNRERRTMYASCLFSYLETYRTGFVWLMAILLAILAVPAAGCSMLRAQSDAVAEDDMESAARAVTQGRYDDAIREYQRISKAHPHRAEILSNLGIAYHLKGDYAEAIEALSRALREEPELISANLFLGIDYLKINQPARAIPPLENVLRLKPQNFEAHLALGTAYLGRREYLVAIQELETAARMSPGSQESWYQLGRAYLKLGDDATNRLWQLDPDIKNVWTRLLVAEIDQGSERYKSAELELKRLARVCPSLAGVHSGLGQLYLATGRLEEANEQLQEELNLSSENLDAWCDLMELALLKDDLPKALDYVRKITEISPAYLAYNFDFISASFSVADANSLLRRLEERPLNQPSFHDLRALLHAQAGDLEAARKEIQVFSDSTQQAEAGDKQPSIEIIKSCAKDSKRQLHPLTDLSPRLSLTSCLFYRGTYAAAFAQVNSVLPKDPDDSESLYWQAKVCKVLAIGAFWRIVTIDPDSFRAHQLQAQIYAAKFQLEQAVEQYAKVIQMRPNLASPHLELGIVYREHAKYELAAAEVEEALELSPGDVEANYVLGDIYSKADEPAKAVPFLAKAVQLDPEFLEARLALGKTYRQEGEFADAIVQLQAALPLDRSGEIHYQLANLYRKIGQVEKAQKEMTVFEKIHKERLAALRERGIFIDSPGPR